VLGDPLGRHAVLGRHWFWTPLRVVLLLATITLTLGWLAKALWPQTYRGSVAFCGRWVGCRLVAYDQGGLHEKIPFGERRLVTFSLGGRLSTDQLR
jgi:uncharacterized membrane protein